MRRQDITPVRVDGVVVGWIEYDPKSDTWKATVKDKGSSGPFPYRAHAERWIRDQQAEGD